MSAERRVRDPALLGPLTKLVLACLWLALCVLPVLGVAELGRPGLLRDCVVLHDDGCAACLPDMFPGPSSRSIFNRHSRIQADHAIVGVAMVLWIVVVASSSGLFLRVLGWLSSGEVVEGDPERGLEHLSAFARNVLREVRSIRADIDATPLALERTWRLAQALAAASPDLRAELEAYGARLEGVDVLAELTTRPGRRGLARRALRQRLDAELAAFEAALVQPRRGGYR
jgi:hypothetical protein